MSLDTASASGRRYRVVQWATGALGRSAIRCVLERDDMERDAARMSDEWGRPGYSLRLDGRPPLTLSAGEEWVSGATAAASAHAVNSVPAVCGADPGIRTYLDLPMISGRMHL